MFPRKLLTTLFSLILVHSTLQGQQPDLPGQVIPGETPVNEAYLFAHMTHEDYGKLYYSVSRDGLHWQRLNNGQRVMDAYKGHPDICQGHDGRYYLVGNQNDASLDIHIWVSDDLLSWQLYHTYTPDLATTPGYEHALQRLGAPKLYFDAHSQQYLLTWHTPHLEGTKEDGERYWASQRTLYVVSKDLKQFSAQPHRLFDWDIGTIDTIVRYIDGNYYAILKDETYPTLYWVTGKTIRIAKSPNLTGPYSFPGAPISPNFREAPTLIPSPDNRIWYLYYEQYPGVSYGLSVADHINGPWFQASGYTFFSDWDKYSLPSQVRHGCMLPISLASYDRLVQHFGIDSQEE